MKQVKTIISGMALVFAGSVVANATAILREYAISIDGTITDTFNPPGGLTAIGGVSYDTFNPNTGLGKFTISVSGLGAHDLRVFFDHDVGPLIDDDVGAKVGSPVSGQTWEIDEPGYANNGYTGNIWDNFSGGTLDKTINLGGTGTPNAVDDMALAMGWSFTGPADLTVTVSEQAPSSGFYLRQDDTLTSEKLYLSAVLVPKNPPPPGVPDGGATVTSLAFGLATLGLLRKKLGR